MEPKKKRSKEAHLAVVLIPAGTLLQDMLTGESFSLPKDSSFPAWYTLEKYQWFYWTVFYKDSIRGDRLVKIRRDRVEMKSGSHRVVDREVIQKRMSRVLSKNTLEFMALPAPPRTRKAPPEGVASELWHQMYIDFFELSSNIYGRKPEWSEERKEKASVHLRKIREEKEKASHVEPDYEVDEEWDE